MVSSVAISNHVSYFRICVATARFGEAIVDFLADEERAASKGIRTEDFEGEAYSIYELFSTLWLQSKEAKVNDTIGMGEMSTYPCRLVSC